MRVIKQPQPCNAERDKDAGKPDRMARKESIKQRMSDCLRLACHFYFSKNLYFKITKKLGESQVQNCVS